MARQTVDYGIDLGTTNSAIARMEKKGPRIIKSRYQSDTIPSAVALGVQGEILVGEDALKDPRLTPAVRFKRIMGTQQTVKLADGSLWSPVDLSAEVLKELKASVRRRYDEDLTHVVITVPAMFQQPQCEATYQAARNAGLEAVALLQEPIAAATAYLSDEPEEGYYLVYDLGGGTFDVSLIQVEMGEMRVVAHGGDNFLGGSDFDKRIHEWVIQQIELGYGRYPQLNTPAARWTLMRECERAKIRLTDEEKTTIDLSYFELPIAKMEITRAILNDLIEDLVEKTVFHTKMRIDEARISSEDIHAILLVGGPTQMPYIRERLRSDLGIETRLEDPMTIVALGAAVHASTILSPSSSTRAVRHENKATLELHYNPVSPDPVAPISGTVVYPEGFQGQVRLERETGDWDTGWLQLNNGAFVTEVSLTSQPVTTFKISLRDAQGNILDVEPNAISMRWGTAPARPVAPYHYGVALDDGTMDVIIEEGTPLPAYGRPREYRTNRAVTAGTDEVFIIYFLEGHSRIARDNIKVGELRITGKQFKRTLRQDEKVEVRMRMDESRRLSARVYIPTFDEEFPVLLEAAIQHSTPETLKSELQEVRQMISEVEDFVAQDDQDLVIRAAGELERLDEEIRDVDSDTGMVSEEAQQRLSRLKQTLRPIHNRHKIDATYKEISDLIEHTENLCQQFNDRMGLATLQDLKKELDRCKRLNNLKDMETIRDRVIEIGREHAMKTPEFWVGLVVWLAHQAPRATNQAAFIRAVEKARQSLERGDVDGVRLNAAEAFQYLPDEGATNPYGDAILRA
jgi:molecular chaperone DnaK